MSGGFTRSEVDLLTLEQIRLYSERLDAKQSRDLADKLYLDSIAASGDTKAINEKLRELRG